MVCWEEVCGSSEQAHCLPPSESLSTISFNEQTGTLGQSKMTRFPARNMQSIGRMPQTAIFAHSTSQSCYNLRRSFHRLCDHRFLLIRFVHSRSCPLYRSLTIVDDSPYFQGEILAYYWRQYCQIYTTDTSTRLKP